MTRFARADGSKGSNKRTLEEATPWSEMVQQRQKKTSKQNTKEEKQTTKNEESISKKRKIATEITPDESTSINTVTEKSKEKKKKKKKKTDPEEEIPEFKLNEEGQRMKVFKDGKERPYFDLPYEESDTMTRFEGFWVQKDDFNKLMELKQSLEDEELDATMMKRKMMKAKRKAHKELRIKLVLEQKHVLESLDGENQSSKERKNIKKIDKTKNAEINKKEPKQNKHNKKNKEKVTDKNEYKNSSNSSFKSDFKEESLYVENDYMTCYDGYWVRKAAIPKLEAMKIIRYKQIIKKREETDSNNKDLTKDEEIQYQRLLKKEKRNEAAKLKSDVRNQRYYLEDESEYEGFNFHLSNGMDTSDMMKFDGIWMKKEGAERLYALKEKLMNEGLSEEELAEVMKKERRKEERDFKTDKKMTCFNCRQSGHMMSQCPNIGSGANTIPVSGVCFKCGSTEHKASSCTAKGKTEFAYASCFICGQTGHISRSCPDNPKGLYPNGGCCKVCGSVVHLAKDCPEKQEENQDDTIRLKTIDSSAIETLDDCERWSFNSRFGMKKQNKKIIF